MKFGKVYEKGELDSINWDLPSIAHPNNQPAVGPTSKLCIGSTGWGEKSWIGKLYPEKTKMQDYLKFYSQHFNSVELNTTHYREPEPEIIAKWRAQVPTTFKFCPKVYQLISHYGGMNNKQVVTRFFDKCRYFEENLGLIFLQVSDSFSITRIKQLETFISFVPQDVNIAIEVRHESWFPLQTEFLDMLSSKNISLVVDDVAGRRDILHLYLTSNNLMVRFVGNELHSSDYKRLSNWSEKIKEIKSTNTIENLYFFIHQPDGVMVPETLDYIKKTLNSFSN